MNFFRKKDSLPLFSPKLGKATVDVGLLCELTKLQLEKWGESHAAAVQAYKGKKSLVATLNSFARQMDGGVKEAEILQEIHSVTSKLEERNISTLEAAIKDLKRLSEADLASLQNLLTRCKAKHKQWHKAAMKNKDEVKKSLMQMEASTLEAQLFEKLAASQAKVSSSIASHIRALGETTIALHTDAALRLRDSRTKLQGLAKVSSSPQRTDDNPLLSASPLGDTLDDFKGAVHIPDPSTLQAPPEPPRYEGEGKILKVEKVVLVLKRLRPIVGVIYATNYRMVFVPYLESKDTGSASSPLPWLRRRYSDIIKGGGARESKTAHDGDPKPWFAVPWLTISRIENEKGVVKVYGKDLTKHVLSFHHAEIDGSKFKEHVEPMLWPSSMGKTNGKASKKTKDVDLQRFFAFWRHKAISASSSPKPNEGWFDWQKEYARMGIPDKKCWVVYKNKDYAISPTYPEYLAVPQPLYSHDLEKIAKFRSKKRFPVLCWRLAPEKMATLRERKCVAFGKTHVVAEPKTANNHKKRFDFPGRSPAMLRCAQPQTGLSNRCEVEENIMKWIGTNTCPYTKPKNVFVLDCRPRLNAMANVVKGGGWESAEHYKCMEFEFLGIQNIHVVRESFQNLYHMFRRLPRASSSSPSKYKTIKDALTSGKESWFEHLATILAGANKAVDILYRKQTTVLVHCSDGWDRTPQITGLAQLQLDPYYRTREGFACLVEKEWVGFGHQFAKRIGHGASRMNPQDKNRSPVFLQWLDCVYQLLCQFPEHFEFNELFLIDLGDAVHSCLYGNFLCDTESERKSLEVRQHTFSVWPSLLASDAKYANPAYWGPVEDKMVLVSSCNRADFQIWSSFYSRWEIPPQSLPIVGDASNANRNSKTTKIEGKTRRADPAKANPPPRRGKAGSKKPKNKFLEAYRQASAAAALKGDASTLPRPRSSAATSETGRNS